MLQGLVVKQSWMYEKMMSALMDNDQFHFGKSPWKRF